MHRRLLNLLTPVSLMLGVAVVALSKVALSGCQWRGRFGPAAGSLLTVRTDAAARRRGTAACR